MQHVETGAQSQEFEDSILGAALLCVFWYIGQCGGRFLSQHWKYLPIPSAADVTTFAVLSALRPSAERAMYCCIAGFCYPRYSFMR